MLFEVTRKTFKSMTFKIEISNNYMYLTHITKFIHKSFKYIRHINSFIAKLKIGMWPTPGQHGSGSLS